MPLLFLLSLPAPTLAQGQDKELYEEAYRPQYHFTPAQNWMNDPNGMVYHDGEYHLFYQHNPYGNQWGHMSWGHATSTDMVNWKHQPVALSEADNIMIFSGSAVVDRYNTSGFGEPSSPPMVAIYTGHHTNASLQDQRLAYSTDNGRTWQKYKGNPVLDIGSGEFRDPKVFWHTASGKWIMVVALSAARKVRFYESPDLKEWSLLSEFGPAGSVQGVWECPDLFKLPVEGSDEQKWVLQVDVGNGAYAGGSGAQYFVGDFDGTRFSWDRGKSAINEIINNGDILSDFEDGTFGDWEVTGNAFGDGPVKGTLSAQQPVSGYRGEFVVNSYHQQDGTTGTLTSPVFELTDNYLSFLIGGGNHPQSVYAELIVGEDTVKSATGDNSERLHWISWDVSEWSGKEARIRLVDEATGGWGHILFDHPVLTAEEVPSSAQEINWVDYGADFYASQSWANTRPDDGGVYWLAWMSNWRYAGAIPTSTWRGAMSFPRKVKLRKYSNGIKLVQQPVESITKLRGEHSEFGSRNVTQDQELLKGVSGKLLDIQTVIKPNEAGDFGFSVRQGQGEETRIGYDTEHEQMYVDRSNSGNTGFNGSFAAVHRAPLPLGSDSTVELRILVDESSVEVFGNGGRSVITDRIFPGPESDGIEFYTNGNLMIKEMDIWKLHSMYDIDTDNGAKEEQVSVNPEEFTLGQNYPNPFNPKTRIDYSVAEAGQIKLVVYSLLGQKVETLVDKHQNPGRYRVNFDGSTLASGVYIYKLKAGDYHHQTRTMTLLK